MAENKKPFLVLLLTMASIVIAVGGITIGTLYNVAFSQEREHLIETAQSHARLIEAIASFDSERNLSYLGGSEAATISQLKEAHRNYRGFGETGEFTLAKREADNIVFILSHRHHDLDKPKPVPFSSTLAEPMRRALSGESGSIIGLDYRGATVLAAFEPVAVLNMGIVAKLDLTEVRAPFVQASAILIGLTLFLLGFGGLVFKRVSNPIIRRMSDQLHELEVLNQGLEAEVEKRTNLAVSRMEQLITSQQETIEVNQQVNNILNSIHDAFFAVDNEWRLTYANSQAEAIFEHSLEEMEGQVLWDIIPEFASAFYRPLTRSKNHQEPTSVEGHYPPLQRWFDMRAYPSKEGLSVYLLDDTDRHMAEDENIHHRDHLQDLVAEKTIEVEQKAIELEGALIREKEYNALQQKFVALVSHEFRTPITIIDGVAQRLIRLKDRLDPEDIVTRAEKVRSAVARMVGLIDITLYASSLDAGKIDVKFRPCNIRKLVTDTCDIQAELSPFHQIKLDVDKLPEDSLLDQRLIDQVFTNLLSNSVKYAPDNPLIEVTGWMEKHTICVSITDHGMGIPANEMPNMFQRFFRTSTVTNIKGTGLGLSICREFVEMHGGDISVDSVEDEGSTFIVRLPVSNQLPSESGHQSPVH